MEELVRDVGALIRAGKARAWGLLNWPPALIAEGAHAAATQGVPAACAVQLPYSLAQRAIVEDPAMTDALSASGAVVVASYVLSGGALTGKYADPSASGRLAGQLDDPAVRRALAVADELRALATRAGTTPSALAIAFPLLNPSVASVLFGATSPRQVSENVRAVELLPSLDEATVAELRRIGT
jgi:aryl-alcohol dehydrogenase-like predicted oxidoreductase